MISAADAATWGIAAFATFGVIARPWNWPEFIWAISGAALLIVFGLLPWADALTAAGKGTDVYFFLIGMMLLAEVARKEGLFDWLAARAVRTSRGSAPRLFLIVYLVGTMVTILLSNDATAVVLTPAVYAATRAAKVEPLPYLFACAFIANAASFVLPISNPANLVVFGKQMPPLVEWLRLFALPSLAAVVATYLALRLAQHRALDVPVATIDLVAPLTRAGKLAACRHSVDGSRAAHGLRDRSRSRAADFHRRVGRNGACIVDRTTIAAAGIARRLVVGAAAGGGSVHSR